MCKFLNPPVNHGLFGLRLLRDNDNDIRITTKHPSYTFKHKLQNQTEPGLSWVDNRVMYGLTDGLVSLYM